MARGPIVEMKTLASSRLWAAGLDAYENELHLDNVVLLPHIGSVTYETRKKMCFWMLRICSRVCGMSIQKTWLSSSNNLRFSGFGRRD